VRNEESKKIHYGILEEVSAEAVIVRTRAGQVAISLKKARLLHPNEALGWEIATLPRLKKVFSFIAPEGLDAGFLSQFVAGLPGVAKAVVVDVYNNPSITAGYKKVSLRVEVPESPSGGAALEKIAHLLLGIGCAQSESGGSKSS
jgi:ferredoxin-fold anticodon binding domain-containing protein